MFKLWQNLFFDPKTGLPWAMLAMMPWLSNGSGDGGGQGKAKTAAKPKTTPAGAAKTGTKTAAKPKAAAASAAKSGTKPAAKPKAAAASAAKAETKTAAKPKATASSAAKTATKTAAKPKAATASAAKTASKTAAKPKPKATGSKASKAATAAKKMDDDFDDLDAIFDDEGDDPLSPNPKFFDMLSSEEREEIVKFNPDESMKEDIRRCVMLLCKNGAVSLADLADKLKMNPMLLRQLHLEPMVKQRQLISNYKFEVNPENQMFSGKLD